MKRHGLTISIAALVIFAQGAFAALVTDGLVYQLDASTNNNFTFYGGGGTAITNWVNNASGGAPDMSQPIIDKAPVWVADALGSGLHAVSFNNNGGDPNDEFLSGASAVDLGIDGTSSNFTIFVVGKGDTIFSDSDATGAGGHTAGWYGIFAGEDQLAMRCGHVLSGSLDTPTAVSGVDNTANYIVAYQYDGDGRGADSWANGTSGGSASFVGLTTTESAILGTGIGFHIGRNGTSTLYHEGYVGEVLVYDRRLTLTEMEQVHDYLGAKWNIAVSPPEVPVDGLLYWLDGSQVGYCSLYNGGMAIKRWHSRAGGDLVTTWQNDINQSPVFITDGWGSGTNAVSFSIANGTAPNDEFLNGPKATDFGIDQFTNSCTMFLVASNKFHFNNIELGGTNYFGFTSEALVLKDSFLQVLSADTGIDTNNYGKFVNTYQYDGSTYTGTAWNNGVLGGTDTFLIPPAGDLENGYHYTFGRVGRTSIYSEAMTAEMLIYNRELSESEINQVGSYLGAKWGIDYVVLPPMIVELAPFSGDTMRMVINLPSAASLYGLRAKTDLVTGSWTNVAHSDDVSHPYYTTNLGYSAEVGGTNEVVYVKSDVDDVKFFKIVEE